MTESNTASKKGRKQKEEKKEKEKKERGVAMDIGYVDLDSFFRI